MYQIITESMFHDAFRNMNRLDQFSYEARSALYDYLVSCEDDEKQIELDVIALCCEYQESSFEEVASYYDQLKDEDAEGIIDYLEENTMVVWHNDESILYLQF